MLHPHIPEIHFPLFLTPLCSGRLLNFRVFPCLPASGLLWSARSTGSQSVQGKWDQVFIPSSLQAETPRVGWVPLSEVKLLSGSHSLPSPLQAWHGKSTPIITSSGVLHQLLFSLIPVPIFINACVLLKSPQITHSKCVIFFLTDTQVNQKSYAKIVWAVTNEPGGWGAQERKQQRLQNSFPTGQSYSGLHSK